MTPRYLQILSRLDDLDYTVNVVVPDFLQFDGPTVELREDVELRLRAAKASLETAIQALSVTRVT